MKVDKLNDFSNKKISLNDSYFSANQTTISNEEIKTNLKSTKTSKVVISAKKSINKLKNVLPNAHQAPTVKNLTPPKVEKVSDNVIKNLIPFFKNNTDTIYLDSAATSLRPQVVIDSITNFYNKYSTSIDRSGSIISLSLKSEIEDVRSIIKKIYNSEEVFFTYSATDGANQIATMIGQNISLKAKNKILLAIDNHHANLLPYYDLVDKFDLTPEFIKLDSNGYTLDYNQLSQSIDENVRIITLNQKSNVTGSELDWQVLNKIFKNKRNQGFQFVVVTDFTQYIAVKKPNFNFIESDFNFVSGHKMYSANGVGMVFYNSKYRHWLPARLGGGIVKQVFEKSVEFYTDGTQFESGTLDYASILSIKPAANFLEKYVYSNQLPLDFSKLMSLKNNGYQIISDTNCNNIISLIHLSINSYDIAKYLDINDIIVRSGYMCAQPLLDYLGYYDGCLRISTGAYTTQSDLDILYNQLVEITTLYT